MIERLRNAINYFSYFERARANDVAFRGHPGDDEGTQLLPSILAVVVVVTGHGQKCAYVESDQIYLALIGERIYGVVCWSKSLWKGSFEIR